MALTHRLGALDLAVLSDGEYYVDAGAVFGVVPRLLWEGVAGPLDAQHRLSLALNCLLLRSQGRLILIETGVGDKPGARRFASPAAQVNLLADLAAIGVRPEEVDIVINTHLHADHCGWNTRIINGALVPTFANAEYIVTRTEWLAAMVPDERTAATYLADNLEPLAGRVRLIDGETKVTDEVTIVPTPGHTEGHASVVIASAGETALYIGDVVQTAVQLERTAWVSAFDILPLISMETKKRLVERALREGSLIISVHAPYPGLGRLQAAERGPRWTPAGS
jgi:glyoxylase-like metal-dependent hydrolase (beta-lactamase superfamily II)